ncbi:helix-turn-helix domain-containing protein [Kribbella solani]|uniref:helix-turn-helix domain-containing protein n=1 Tax=Kribbella solani TaxID=236067 RepID=UPI0029A56125|nr:helix-turn-helix domain-containing protein [Kribbella solani]MDX2974267.1 helix-turn-helix domain-containing protein [Kribbella solani]
MAIDTAPRWTVEDVAAYLGIPVKTLYRWRAPGQEYGPVGVRIGKHIRYDPQDVIDWFQALKTAA